MNYLYRLFLSLFLCSATVLGMFSVIAYLAFEQVYTARLRTQNLATARKAALALDQAVEEYIHTAENFFHESAGPAFLRGFLSGDGTLNLLRQMYGLKNSFHREASLTVLSLRTGEALFTGPENPRLETPQYYKNWGAFRRAGSTKGVIVHTVSRDAVLSESTRICIAQAFRDLGGVSGYLIIEVPRSTLAAIAGENAAQYNTALMLVDRNRTVIYHSKGISREGLGKVDALPGLEEAWDTMGSGVLPGGGFVYSVARKSGLMVLQEIPNDIVPQLRKVLSNTAFAALLLSLPLCLLLAYLIAQSVSRPVQRLKSSMEKVRRGDLGTKVEVTGHDEISELGKTFNEMTEQIQWLIQNVEEKQKSLRVAEGKALSLQVNPHFIYNTLELIRWSAKMNKNDVAVSITVNFGKLLRRILNNKDDLVTVGYEMEMVNAYVGIQKQRYGERLSVTCTVPPELEQERVPKLILQPLLENAIVHGLEGKPGKGEVSLSVICQGDYLYFTVTDNGIGMSKETLDQVRALKENGMYNIGLHNVHERAVLYGDENCGLQINSALGEGTRILLTVKRQQGLGERERDV